MVRTQQTLTLSIFSKWAPLVAQMVKTLPAMQEMQVRSVGWEDPLEKLMATHFSILAWRIPLAEEPCGLQSMGSQRVGPDWANAYTQRHFQQTLKHLMNTFLVVQTVKNLPAMETWNLPASAEDKRLRFDPWVEKIPWRIKWQPNSGFLPGKFHGQRSMTGYSSWGRKESDTTEQLTLSTWWMF